MKFSRRQLITKGAAAVSAATYIQESSAKNKSFSETTIPLVISTWAFGESANKKALQVYKKGGSILDAVEQGINLTEDDKDNTSVGYRWIA